jgi:hypothetical protein
MKVINNNNKKKKNKKKKTVVGEIIKIIVLLFRYLVRISIERMANVKKIFPNVEQPAGIIPQQRPNIFCDHI